ncbi:MAG: efflux RND transporter permease subunit [Gammaproteobacteria bacterium]|nr:efflux RND transporter permease subunit [Gammaproteobacteria bacterium]
MNLTRLALDNNRVTLVLVLTIIVAGISTFEQMPRAYDPGFIVRSAQVITYFPGASPERVEQLIASKLEESIKQIPEVDYVRSESRTGVAIVTVNIKQNYDAMRPIWDDLRRKMTDVAEDLPDGALGPYVNDEFGDVFGIVLTITGEGFDDAELNDIAETVRDELQRLPDAATVEIHGDQEERVFVEYEDAVLAKLDYSPYQLSQALATRNIVLSGGSITLGDERIALEPSGNFESIDDIRKTILRIPGSDRLVYLGDIATVSRGYVDPPSTLVRSSGQRALAVALSMRDGGNNIALGEQVLAQVARFEQRFPHGVEFELVNFSPAEVEKKVSDFVANLLQAIAVVSAVMLLTLGLRTGLIVASLIPLTMLLAILLMSAFSIGLDQISLAALIIALGMLVDNGIVMSENIMVQMENGKRAADAAIEAAAELRTPLLTASLTTAAAFLPIYLAESDVGEFTASLFKVVTITLLSSWIISLTVIPLLCVAFLKVTQQSESFDGPLFNGYRRVLSAMLRHRSISVLVTAAIFIVSLAGFGLLPNIFFPPSDRTYFKVELELPTSTSIETTADVVTDIEQFLHRVASAGDGETADVTSWISYIGYAGPRFVLSHNPVASRSSYALLIVNVPTAEVIDGLMNDLRAYAADRHPDLDMKLRKIETGPSIENPVEVRLSGSNSAHLFSAVDELKREMDRVGGLRNITDDWGQRIKQLNIRIDQARALRADISSQDIAASLQAGLSGLQLTEYREGEDVIPVLLRSSTSKQEDIGKLESLSVFAQATGKSIPLRQVADVEVAWDAARIYRRDGVRTVAVGAQIDSGVTASEKFDALAPWLTERQQAWGDDIRIELGGEFETSAESSDSISEKLPIAGFLILILLVAQFNSLRKSFIVLMTIPLGLIGVVIGLLVADSFFGFMTLLGVISLAGIVINNAIVLLERIQTEIDNGLEHGQAIVSAALQRARPILLTTATTVLGLIPLYLGGGEMWEPMAVAIMGGLLFSTLLTLGVVPVLYSLLFRVRT